MGRKRDKIAGVLITPQQIETARTASQSANKPFNIIQTPGRYIRKGSKVVHSETGEMYPVRTFQNTQHAATFETRDKQAGQIARELGIDKKQVKQKGNLRGWNTVTIENGTIDDIYAFVRTLPTNKFVWIAASGPKYNKRIHITILPNRMQPEVFSEASLHKMVEGFGVFETDGEIGEQYIHNDITVYIRYK
jgi:hypothetical protein